MYEGLYDCEDEKLIAMLDLIDEPFDFGTGLISPEFKNDEFAYFHMCYKFRKNLELDYQEYLDSLEYQEEDVPLSKTEGRTRAERRRNTFKKINKRENMSKIPYWNNFTYCEELNRMNKSKVVFLKDQYYSMIWHDGKLMPPSDKRKLDAMDYDQKHNTEHNIGRLNEYYLYDFDYEELRDLTRSFDISYYEYGTHDYYLDWLDEEQEWEEFSKFIDSADFYGDEIYDTIEEE